MTMTALDHFRKYFPEFDLSEDIGTSHGLGSYDTSYEQLLTEVTDESPCGQDCVKAIEATAELTKHIEMAYGERGAGHPTGLKIYPEVVNAVLEVCCCYIRG